MTKCIRTLTMTLAIMLLPVTGFSVKAQDAVGMSLGTFHSPKGFGISIDNVVDSISFNAFTLIADMHGVLTGEHPRPGVKFTYTRNFILRHFDKEYYVVDLYAGPGVTAGYLRDIHKSYGLMAGLSCLAGSRFSFPTNFSVSIELCADIALEINRNQRYGNVDLSLYKSGLFHAYFPQLKIHYCF